MDCTVDPSPRFQAAGKHRATRGPRGLFTIAKIFLGLGLILVAVGMKTPAGILIATASLACAMHATTEIRKVIAK